MTTNNKTKAFSDYAKDKTWETPGQEELNDGMYTGVISKGEVKLNAKDDWCMVLHIDVGSENAAGRKAFFYGAFEKDGEWNPWGPKGFFEGLGLELPEFEEMEESIADLVIEETAISFELKTKGKFQNFITHEILDDYEPEERESDDDDNDNDNDITEDEVNEMSKKELIACIESNEIEYDGKETPKPMKAAIIEWLENEDDDDEDDEDEDDEDNSSDDSDDLPDADEVDEMSKEDCLEFIEDKEIEGVKGSVKKLRAGIIAWIDEQDDEDEDEDEDEDDNSELVEFCVSHGVDDIDDDSTLEEIIDELEGYDFEESELDNDEIKLLKDNNLEGIIIAPKKKDAKKKKKKK